MPLYATILRKLSRLSILSDPRSWWFYAQRRVMGIDTRAKAAAWLARRRPRAAFASDAAARAAAVAAMQSDGFVPIDHRLSPAAIAEMVTYLRGQPVFASYERKPRPTMIDDPDLPDSHVLFHDPEAVVRCPHALAIANDPRVLDVIRGLFGCEPTIGFMTAWWSIPTKDGVPRQAENFHRDVDDMAFIKMFLYLSDVGEDTGPHVYMRGSHADDRLLSIGRFEDSRVFGTFGDNAVVEFRGPAGTSFLENTFGLHRGRPVVAGKRLIFQVVYSLFPLVYSPRKPVARSSDFAGLALDPWINRVYVAPGR